MRGRAGHSVAWTGAPDHSRARGDQRLAQPHITESKNSTCCPAVLDADATLDSEVLYRGIHEVPGAPRQATTESFAFWDAAASGASLMNCFVANDSSCCAVGCRRDACDARAAHRMSSVRGRRRAAARLAAAHDRARWRHRRCRRSGRRAAVRRLRFRRRRNTARAAAGALQRDDSVGLAVSKSHWPLPAADQR